jgi:hypothetical protein
LLAESLHEVGANAETALKMKANAEVLGAQCEQVLEDLFQVKQIKGSTYLTDLCNKVDTVIRKNYQQITE